MFTDRLKLEGRPVHHLTWLGSTFPKMVQNWLILDKQRNLRGRTEGRVGFID